MLAAAINTGNNLLYLLLGLLIAAVPLCWVGARRNPGGAGRGGPSAAKAQGRIPVPDRGSAEVPTPVAAMRAASPFPSREKGPATGRPGSNGVPAGQTVNVRFTGRHAQRGRRTITAVHLSSTWPLELFRRARKIESRAGFIVLPAGDPGATGDARTLPQAGLAGLDARVAGQEFAGLQRGSERDDIRRIDWKTTARRGELVLRETAGESRSRLELRLLTRRFRRAPRVAPAVRGRGLSMRPLPDSRRWSGRRGVAVRQRRRAPGVSRREGLRTIPGATGTGDPERGRMVERCLH